MQATSLLSYSCGEILVQTPTYMSYYITKHFKGVKLMNRYKVLNLYVYSLVKASVKTRPHTPLAIYKLYSSNNSLD